MHALTASDLLTIWERGIAQTPLSRALSILDAAFPESGAEELELLTIGKRDGLLLTMRERTFGSAVNAVATCEACQGTVELSFDTRDLKVEMQHREEEVTVTTEEHTLRLRIPNSRDLAAVLSREPGPGAAELFARCVLSGNVADLPSDAIETAGNAIAAADRQADIRLAITCPACAETRRLSFDIVSFLWGEIESLAIRTPREIHALASAYGWAEAEILSLSPARRRCYLEMAQA